MCALRCYLPHRTRIGAVESGHFFSIRESDHDPLRHTSHTSHDNDISSNQKCRLLDETYVLEVRYNHPLVYTNGSDVAPFAP